MIDSRLIGSTVSRFPVSSSHSPYYQLALHFSLADLFPPSTIVYTSSTPYTRTSSRPILHFARARRLRHSNCRTPTLTRPVRRPILEPDHTVPHWHTALISCFFLSPHSFSRLLRSYWVASLCSLLGLAVLFSTLPLSLPAEAATGQICKKETCHQLGAGRWCW